MELLLIVSVNRKTEETSESAAYQLSLMYSEIDFAR